MNPKVKVNAKGSAVLIAASAGCALMTDETDGRTRLEIRQWLPEHLAGPSEEGWLEAFTKLDATLISAQAVAANHQGVVAWPS